MSEVVCGMGVCYMLCRRCIDQVTFEFQFLSGFKTSIIVLWLLAP